MKKSRYGEERIIAILTQHEAGLKTTDVRRRHGFSAAMFYGWKSKVWRVSERGAAIDAVGR